MKQKLYQFWKPLLAITFWGASFVATKFALDELKPVTLIVLRLILAIILLSIVANRLGRDFKISLRDLLGTFLLALIICFHLWIQVTGLQFTSASNTGWIIGTTPVFMAMLGRIFFNEKFTLSKLIGTLIAFIGLILLISKGDFLSIDFISNKGDFMVLASAFTWAVFSSVNKRVTTNYSPLMTTLFQFLFMLMILLPFTVNQESLNSVLHLSRVGWISILFLGIFCSGVAYVLWAQSLKAMDSAKVGAFLYIEPFVTILTAWIFLNEQITVLMVVSGLIITSGVYLVNRD